MYLRETRMIYSELLTLENEIDLYWPDKVAFVMYSGDEMSWVIVHSKKLYTTLRWLFNYIWKDAEK